MRNKHHTTEVLIYSCVVTAEAPALLSSGLQLLQQSSCPAPSDHIKPKAPRKWPHRQKGRRARGQTHDWSAHSHGSLPMNCGPGLCWEGGGLGVPTSLFLAILVLALANSSLKVWGISGSNRTPCDQAESFCVMVTKHENTEDKKTLLETLIHDGITNRSPPQRRAGIKALNAFVNTPYPWI